MNESSRRLRVAMAQINFRVGDIEKNSEQILEAMDRAREDGADLAVFSELALMGYPPRDMVDRRSVLQRQDRALEEIAAATDDALAVVVGFVDQNDENKGHRLVNAAAFCANGEVERRISKQLLPTYDVFDERRYFHARSTDGVVCWKGVKVGISICEDAWARVQSREMPDYVDDPVEALVDSGAAVLVNIAASPFSLNKEAFRRDLLADHCKRHNKPLVFVNQIGGHDELIFDGRSLALDADGNIQARLAGFEEDFQIVELNPGAAEESGGAQFEERTGSDSEIEIGDNTRAEQARDAVVLGIRDYVRKSNFSDVILGLSGGIDSSLSAVLAVDALGAEHVHGVAMPSRFSSSHSREDARRLGNNLGIAFDEIAIELPYQGMLESLQPHFEDPSFGVTEENIQARIRGIYLMALSNKTGKLVLACGNKSELAVGYTTLYGDMCGALAVIGDLPKMLVYEIARLYNEEAGEPVIPKRVLTKAPSAELRADQKDEDSLPPYEVLDSILDQYVVEHRTIEEIVEAGFDEVVVRDVVAKIHRSEFKRWQAPPILKVTTKAFGVGWRYPLAAKY